MVKHHLKERIWSRKCYSLFAYVFICIISVAFGDQRMQNLLAADAAISNDTLSEAAAEKTHNLFTVFSNNSEDVLQFLLNTANSSNHLPKDVDNKQQEKIEIDLDETRSELLRILQNEIRVQEDSETHELLQTISETKFRKALDDVLKRQLSQARKSFNEQPLNNDANNQTTPNPTSSVLISQGVCQFFVFGTLFGIVCSISTCTCCLKPRTGRGRSTDFSEVNPTNVPAPIDYSKPYMLKCDSRGSCYASPLSDDEVPPLPSYSDALKCARQPTPTRKTSKPNDDTTIAL